MQVDTHRDLSGGELGPTKSEDRISTDLLITVALIREYMERMEGFQEPLIHRYGGTKH
jgi:hypothetical protein